MGMLKHTPLAQSVGKGDVDVITPLEVSESDLALGSVGCFESLFFTTQVTQYDPRNNNYNSPGVTTIFVIQVFWHCVS